jgi:hypothetical protein
MIPVMRKAIWFLLIVAVTGGAQRPQTPRPDFKQFAVKWVYVGPPVTPKIPQSWRGFRTMIRKGANAPTQFAGHYTVPSWGCGAGCSVFVIADSVTGTIYDGFSVADLPPKWIDQWTAKHDELPRVEFHPESRLFKVNGCPGEHNCGLYDYMMTEKHGLKLVRKELLPKEFQ